MILNPEVLYLPSTPPIHPSELSRVLSFQKEDSHKTLKSGYLEVKRQGKKNIYEGLRGE